MANGDGNRESAYKRHYRLNLALGVAFLILGIAYIVGIVLHLFVSWPQANPAEVIAQLFWPPFCLFIGLFFFHRWERTCACYENNKTNPSFRNCLSQIIPIFWLVEMMLDCISKVLGFISKMLDRASNQN